MAARAGVLAAALASAQAVMTEQPDGYRRSLTFEWPEEVPWSELGPEFARVWGNRNGKFMPEFIEITGQNGSGKTYFLATILQERARARDSSEIIVATKPDDDSLPLLGWPVTAEWKDVQKYRQCIFWPRTDKKGQAREAYHEEKIYDLLARLWTPEANTVLAFDEIGYVEELSARIKKMIRMYWREARSQGITIVAMKQRPVGVVREQHSETKWKAVFPPADRGDMDRFAELLGTHRDWTPVLESLDQEAHQFVLRHTLTGTAYITWVDTGLRPVEAQADPPDRTPREYLFGRKKTPA